MGARSIERKGANYSRRAPSFAAAVTARCWPAYNPRQQVSAAASSRRVKRERGAASGNTFLAKAAAAPATVSHFEVRSSNATAASRGGKAERSARLSPETGLRPGSACRVRGAPDRRPQRGWRCARSLSRGRGIAACARRPCADVFRAVPIGQCRAGMHGATRSRIVMPSPALSPRAAARTSRIALRSSSCLPSPPPPLRCTRNPLAVRRRPTLDPVAVTASRTPQPIADLLADLTVIQADEILRSGAQSLPQLLQRQPGVEVTINGGPGATSGAFLRGANARPDAGADRRPARGIVVGRRDRRSKPSRSTRSSASRSCADRRRACTAPTRSAA